MTAMIISLIAAMGRNRVIGKDNTLPWSMPADMAHFRLLTRGKPVIMGRKTYESIGRALPDRINIILTRDAGYRAAGCMIAHSPAAAIAAAGDAPEIMVIGGEQIFRVFLAPAKKMYLTLIDADFKGDARFPEWNADEWRQTAREEHAADGANPHPYRFLTLERI